MVAAAIGHSKEIRQGNPMKTTGYTLKDTRISPSVKWNLLLISLLFIFNCFTFSTWLKLGEVGTKPWLILLWLYGLVALMPLVWRDRASATVFAVEWLLTVIAWPIMPYYAPVMGVPVALYAVAAHHRVKISLLALLASIITMELVAIVVSFREGLPFYKAFSAFTANTIFLFLVTVAAWAAGRLIRASRHHVQQLEAERQRLEHEREVTREAVAAERRRIARELHDIVTHAVTVIVLQAAGAAEVADTDFAQVTESLSHIKTSGKQAMVELRRLLGVLDASEPEPRAAGVGELGPQPGLADLPKLISALETTGLSVTVHTQGTPRELDPSVELAAYRIVQEGLTNILKHAGKDPNPQLRLAWEPDSLRIQIDNDINVETSNPWVVSGSRGLIGLQERAHAAGGSLQAGPHRQGYRLIAILPLADTAQPLTCQQPLVSTSSTRRVNVLGPGRHAPTYVDTESKS
jgi:signal transduction histidine kinase